MDKNKHSINKLNVINDPYEKDGFLIAKLGEEVELPNDVSERLEQLLSALVEK